MGGGDLVEFLDTPCDTSFLFDLPILVQERPPFRSAGENAGWKEIAK